MDMLFFTAVDIYIHTLYNITTVFITTLFIYTGGIELKQIRNKLM